MTTDNQRKYRPKPFPGSSHTWAQSILATLQGSDSVLDIGAGSGLMGEFLRSRGLTAVDAVEIDEETRKVLKGDYREVFSRLEDVEDHKYDCILLLDVIEHVPEPEQFLKQAATLLKPAGRVLISVPNIAHWSVRFPLLFGFFTYTERGLLDNTHLQFFTRTRVLNLTKHVPSLTLNSYEASISPMEFVLPEFLSDSFLFNLFSRFRHASAQLLPGLLAYQHLAHLRVKT